MEVKIGYKIKGGQEAFAKLVRPQIMGQLETIIQQQVDSYLNDLESHMGSIDGSRAYTDTAVRWDALDETQLKEAPRFWIESGKARRSISVNMKVEGTKISAFVGVSEGSEGYQEVLWNELGFTPQNGDKLIRRPLFIPLAETHKAELRNTLQRTLQNTSIKVNLK